MTEYTGKHLLVDTIAHRLDALLDIEIGKACLTEIAHRIGMTIVMSARGVQFSHASAQNRSAASDQDGSRDQENGYSAVVLLAESHISIHTFPESRFLTFDCYSCAPFDESVAVDILEEVFHLEDANIQVIHRQLPKLTTIPKVTHGSLLVDTKHS